MEFTFPSMADKRQIIIIMEYFWPIDKSCFLRSYDLKGSTINRAEQSKEEIDEINHSSDIREYKIIDKELKDQDFQMLEEDGIHFDTTHGIENPKWFSKKKHILQNLMLDIEYLRKNKLIDYSLQIKKVFLF